MRRASMAGKKMKAKSRAPEIKEVHAHIYYEYASRDAAARVREGLAMFDVRLGGWHDKPVGPHPQSMYQVAFSQEEFGKVVPWLMIHREGLDILVHLETGDPVKDHLDYCLWMGRKLKLDVEIFKRA